MTTGEIKMLTILHTESSTGWGGQEQRTLREATGLTRLGCKVIIACPAGAELGRRAQAAGILVRHCSMRKSFDVTAVWRLARIIARDKVAVVNTHSGRDSFLAGCAARLSPRQPVIVRTRHLAMPLTSKISYSVLPHRVVTVSEYVRQYLLGEGVAPEQVSAITTGIDVARFDPERTISAVRAEFGIGEDVPVIGTIAILRGRKGHQILLQAMPRILEKFPATRFLFAGNGPQEENLRRSIAEQNLDSNVIMMGLRNDIPEVLAALDIFVLPTLQEALGTSFLEAMSMGKAVIGSAVDGVPEVIRDGENGFLVPPSDPDALADRVLRLLADRGLAKRMGEAGKAYVAAEFTVERMCEKMLALYRELLAQRNR